MAGIRNLNITFQIDGGRSARNKLSQMGGIMSSSEELIQAAMPMIEKLIPDSRSEYRKRKDREESFNEDVYLGMRNRMDEQASIRRDAEGLPLNSNNERMTEEEYFNALGPLLDKTDENQMNIRNYGDDAMKGRSFGFPTEMPTQNFMAGGIAKAAPFVIRGATEAAKTAPGILKKTITAGMNLAKAPFKRPITFGAIGFGSYLISDYLNRADKMSNEELGKNLAGTDEDGNVNKDNLNTVISGAGISLTTDKGDKKSTDELISEFKRVAKNTAIADPGSFAERFGKAILTGIATDLSTRGTSGKASTYTPERLRQNIISNLSRDAQVINMLKQPGGQQKFNDLVTKLMQGAAVNVDSTTQGDTGTKFSKGDTATGPDGQKIVFDGTKWTKA
jgi:hypothetical protein